MTTTPMQRHLDRDGDPAPDPIPADDIYLERIAEIDAETDQHRADMAALASERRGIVRSLRTDHGPTELARMLGVSRSRVHRLLEV